MYIIFSLLSIFGQIVSSDDHEYDEYGFSFELKKKNLLLSNCTELFYEQYLDHFNYGIGSTPNNITSFMERYFVCGGSKWNPNNTIFFYFGNEGNIEKFVNFTGFILLFANTILVPRIEDAIVH